MNEQWKAYQEMPESERPDFWVDTPCPKAHPPTVVVKARRGDREAAAQVLEILRYIPGGTYMGVTSDEMTELAEGDKKAVRARRRWKARVRAHFYRNRVKYTRWSVRLDIIVKPGHHLSSHKEFADQGEAMAWAERFIGNPEVLAEYLGSLNDRSSNRGGNYVVSESTELKTLVLLRERQAYPWYWLNNYPAWHAEAVEWYWECQELREQTAAGKPTWSITIGGKQVAPLSVAT